MIQLTDDGTLDTVLRCTECRDEFRYSYDPEAYSDAPGDSSSYDEFVSWAIDDATDTHECRALAATRASKLARRWLRFIEAGERNARVERWWSVVQVMNALGQPIPNRARRMWGVSQACQRIEKVHFATVEASRHA